MGEFNVNKTTGDLEQTAGADNEAKANKSDIAPEFNTTTAYAKGDLVYYQGTLYEFIQAHAAGAWNASHVDAKDIDDVLSDYAALRYGIASSITADGIKTFKKLINELFSGVSVGANEDVFITFEQYRYYLAFRSSATYKFISYNMSSSNFQLMNITYSTSGDNTFANSMLVQDSGLSVTDRTNEVLSSGTLIRIYKRNKL